MWNLYLLAHT